MQLKFLTKLQQFVTIGVVGTLAVTFAKVSALDLFISVFQSNQRFHQAAYVLMGLVSCYGISFTIVSLAACRPFAAQWDKTIPNYKCIDTSAYYMSRCVIGATLDCLVVALPMPMLWGLRMKLSKKITLTAIFGLGISYGSLLPHLIQTLSNSPCTPRIPQSPHALSPQYLAKANPLTASALSRQAAQSSTPKRTT